ncbi:MAG: hypothetical protein ACXVCP_10585 [Bdellovibrio sp.]
MSRFGIVYFLGILLFLVACEPNPDSNANRMPGNGTRTLSYHFKVNNQCFGRSCGPEDDQRCEIKKTFSSHEEYCEGLRDGVSNEYCARFSRKAEYLKNCGENFEDTNINAILAESSNCATDRRLFDGRFTRTQLCDAIFTDMANHPCIKEKHWYDRDIALYDCQSN